MDTNFAVARVKNRTRWNDDARSSRATALSRKNSFKQHEPASVHFGYSNRPDVFVKRVRYQAFGTDEVGQLRRKFAESRADLYRRLAATPESDCGCG